MLRPERISEEFYSACGAKDCLPLWRYRKYASPKGDVEYLVEKGDVFSYEY